MVVRILLIDRWVKEGWEKLTPSGRKKFLELMIMERKSAFDAEDQESPFRGYDTGDIALVEDVELLPRWVFWELRFAATESGLSLSRYVEILKIQTERREAEEQEKAATA